MAAEQECQIGGLPVSMCACRKHRGGRTPEEEAATDRRGSSRSFRAQFSGSCSDCGGEIRPGDVVRYGAGRFGGSLLGPCCAGDSDE